MELSRLKLIGLNGDNIFVNSALNYCTFLPAPASPHNGMLPCFLRGDESTLFASISKARANRARVS